MVVSSVGLESSEAGRVAALMVAALMVAALLAAVKVAPMLARVGRTEGALTAVVLSVGAPTLVVASEVAASTAASTEARVVVTEASSRTTKHTVSFCNDLHHL